MSENNFAFLPLFVYIFLSFFGISSTEYVPVYMWETTQFSEVVPALERVSPESFRNILTERAGKNTPIVLFAEQNLSPEDFTLHDSDGKTPFTHLSSQKESAQISYWPFVKNPCKVVKELANRNKVETSIKSILNDHNFVLRNGDILVVDLNDAREGEDRLQMLKRHDKDIIAVYERLAKENKDILTLYTGCHSSWITSEDLRSHRRARDAGNPENPEAQKPEVQNPEVQKPEAQKPEAQKPEAQKPETQKPEVQSSETQSPKVQSPKAEETGEDTHKLYHNDDVMMFVNDTPILSYNGTKVSFTDFEFNTERNGSELNIIFNSEKKKDITVTIYIRFDNGYWTINDIVVVNTSLPEDLGKQYSLRVRDVYAPVGFSYTCFAQAFYNGSNANQNLSLPGFQIQPSKNGSRFEKFGDPYNCVGFMSAPIWSGIFVTFILAIIMTFGLTMMMDIKTMDRFDDPKGKTITIGAIE